MTTDQRAGLPLRPHQSPLRSLLAWNLGATILGFFALEWWRPCYFLTDDNFSGLWPTLMEMGRRLKEGRSPFYTDYLFGGHYGALRDMGYGNWHPLVMGLSLLADTPAQFWIVDLVAFALLLVTVTGFTVLAFRLREEFSLLIPDGYLVFYVLSFVFSTFILTVGASWMNFLATQSCLPWFMLGLLERRAVRGTFLITLFTIHEFLIGYLGLLVSVSLCFSIVALVLAVARRSIRPLFCWGAGNLLAVFVLSPLILNVLDGFAQSTRVHGMSLDDLTLFAVPPIMFVSSFFAGNWTEPLVRWMGDSHLASLNFPYLPSILACPAAWCVGPALFSRGRWGYLDKLCFGLAVALVLLIIRPHALGVLMQHLPVFRSLRWPFREGLLFLFFVHLFIILRFREGIPLWQGPAVIFGLLVFALPLPFIRPPSLNPLALDRRLLFSGQAAAFWTNVKAMLHPGDQIVTVIDDSFWKANARDIPYSLLGTANFPCFFQVCCGSGYSVTAPEDQKPIKTWPHFWFGAFDEEQVPAILAERPHLRILRVVSTHPLKLTISDGSGPQVDLTPAMRAAGITEAASIPPAVH